MTDYTTWGDLGYDQGFLDGYDGSEYDAYGSQVPEEYDATYRVSYSEGYLEGQDAYRRAMEGLVP